MRRWYHLMAGIAVAATSLLVPLSGASQAVAATVAPTCHITQLKLNLDYTREVRTHTSDEWVGSVRYTNQGSACLMGRIDVGVQAVTRTTHVLIGQPSMDDAVSRPSFTLRRGEVASELVGILVTLPKVARSCVAEPVTTIEVIGYNPSWHNHFFSLARWHELALCAGDHLAAVTGALGPS
jgi:hypothetical protein